MKLKLIFYLLIFKCLIIGSLPIQGQSLAGKVLDTPHEIKIDSLQKQLSQLEENQKKSKNSLAEKQQSKILLTFALLVLLGMAGYFLYLYLLLKQKIYKISAELSQQKSDFKALKVEKQNLDKLFENQEDLMSGVAHDLKAPLNRIYGLIEVFFLQDGNLNGEQKKYLSLAQRVANEARLMVQNWLDVKAIESQKLQVNLSEINLQQLVDDLLTSYQEAAQKKSIDIEYHSKLKNVLYTTDSNLLSRILDNLLSNAVKFSPLNEVVKLRLTEQAKQYIFEVEDHGVGISEQEQGKLFQKFQKLSARPTAGESSTGLGLSIVKTIVAHLKGEIEVESTVGEGSVFRVILPKEYTPAEVQKFNYLEEKAETLS